MEHGIADGDEAVIEWTMTWRDPKSGEKRLNRGTEWFRLEGGRIAEIRAYHHGDARNPRGDLLGFDFGARGYTTLEDWQGRRQGSGSARRWRTRRQEQRGGSKPPRGWRGSRPAPGCGRRDGPARGALRAGRRADPRRARQGIGRST